MDESEHSQGLFKVICAMYSIYWPKEDLLPRIYQLERFTSLPAVDQNAGRDLLAYQTNGKSGHKLHGHAPIDARDDDKNDNKIRLRAMLREAVREYRSGSPALPRSENWWQASPSEEDRGATPMAVPRSSTSTTRDSMMWILASLFHILFSRASPASRIFFGTFLCRTFPKTLLLLTKVVQTTPFSILFYLCITYTVIETDFPCHTFFSGFDFRKNLGHLFSFFGFEDFNSRDMSVFQNADMLVDGCDIKVYNDKQATRTASCSDPFVYIPCR
jgi:hypothetical protein